MDVVPSDWSLCPPVEPGAPGETALQGAIRAELGEAYSGPGLLEKFFFSESV